MWKCSRKIFAGCDACHFQAGCAPASPVTSGKATGIDRGQVIAQAMPALTPILTDEGIAGRAAEDQVITAYVQGVAVDKIIAGSAW